MINTKFSDGIIIMRYFLTIFAHLTTTQKQHLNFLRKLTQLISLLIGFLVRPTQSQQFLTPADFRLALEEATSFLTESDFDNARKFKEILAVTKSRNSILTRQPFYRGDIRGKAAWRRRHWSRRLLNQKSSSSRRFNGVSSVVKKWPNGRIPYVLSSDYSERERAVLARAIQEYHGRTCIRFVPKTPFDRDYLFIGKIDGCYSDVGRAGGKQELSLDNGCLQNIDTAIHELMHSVGFYHEHERWDRDDFLMILWQNIDKDAFDQFGKVDLVESSYYDQPYDYHSIMHYDSLAFTKNGRETLIAKEPMMTAVIGSAIDFSPIDLAKIRRMYNCPDIGTNPHSSRLEFTGDNSITSPVSPGQFPLQTISPFLRSQFPLAAAAAVNFDAKEHPISTPFYFLNRPAIKEPTISESNMDQLNSAKMNCSDRTNFCGYWLPYCHFNSYKRIMRDLCAKSCNFCEKPYKKPDELKSYTFPVLVNAPYRWHQ